MTDIAKENARLRDRVDELEETVRQLRALASEARPLPQWVPYLTRREETMLRLFLARESVSIEAMETVIHDGDAKSYNLLSVYVFKLRSKLAKFGVTIKTLHGRGYSLTPESKALFSQVAA